jgi:hypothetical protein
LNGASEQLQSDPLSGPGQELLLGTGIEIDGRQREGRCKGKNCARAWSEEAVERQEASTGQYI